MNSSHRLKRNYFSRGVTLVEVLIGVMILLCVFLACAQILQSNTRVSLSTFQRIQASQYAEQIINHLRRSNIKELKESYLYFPQIIDDDNYSAKVTISPEESGGPREATVTVQWTEGSHQKSHVVTATLVPA